MYCLSLRGERRRSAGRKDVALRGKVLWSGSVAGVCFTVVWLDGPVVVDLEACVTERTIIEPPLRRQEEKSLCLYIIQPCARPVSRLRITRACDVRLTFLCLRVVRGVRTHASFVPCVTVSQCVPMCPLCPQCPAFVSICPIEFFISPPQKGTPLTAPKTFEIMARVVCQPFVQTPHVVLILWDGLYPQLPTSPVENGVD